MTSITMQAIVCCDQTSAADIGKEILQKGGNAADAAVAMAFAMGILQPMDCGIGGDCNCLFYNAADNTVSAINGTGFSSENLTLEKVIKAGLTADVIERTLHHGLFVTVPGAVSGMFNCIRHFGSHKITMEELIKPAIKLAEAEVAVGPIATSIWMKAAERLSSSTNRNDVLMGLDFENVTEFKVSNPKLSSCMEKIAAKGCEEFYKGEIAMQIVDAVAKNGGVLSMEDMKNYLDYSQKQLPEPPLSVTFHGLRIWEMAPNTTGLVVLVAMKLLEGFDLKALGHNTLQYIHVVAETINLAFYCCWQYLCDPSSSNKNYKDLLEPDYLNRKRKEINFDCHVDLPFKCSEILPGGSTNYISAVDSAGNACSFIFSISCKFGSAIIPDDCGFVLHNRGRFFSVDKSDRNVFGPRKKCLHTIIPAMVTDETTGDLLATFGIIGRWIQPQAHIQVLLNMILFGMDPETAIREPRFCTGHPYSSLNFRKEYILLLEDGIPPSIAASLANKGHKIQHMPCSDRGVFGHGHIIAKNALWSKDVPLSQSRWSASSDPRYDGNPLYI